MAKSKTDNPLGLNDLQYRFCQEYCTDFNASKALERAKGIHRDRESKKKCLPSKASIRQYASELLTKPNVLKCIDQIKKQVADEIKVNTKFIVQTYKTILQRCMQAEVATDAWGNNLPFLTFDAKNAIAAATRLEGYVGGFDKNNTQTHKVKATKAMKAIITAISPESAQRTQALIKELSES
ncbi:MAG: terminase small subunit [Nitrospinales bacterium]